MFSNISQRVSKFAGDTVRWLIDLGRWLLVGGMLWLALIAPLIIGSACVLLGSCLEQVLRVTGVLLELAGLVVVVLGLRETRRLFERPSLLSAARDYLGAFPRFGKPTGVTASANVTMEGIATVTGFGTVGLSRDASVEERIAALERQIPHLYEYMGRKFAETDAKFATDLEAERVARQNADAAHRTLMGAAIAGGLFVEMMGAFWLFLGIVLAGVPGEIAWMLGAAPCSIG